MKNFRFTSRRHFIWMASMSSILATVSGFSRKSLAQQSPIVPGSINRVPGTLNQRVFRLPANSQLLLRDIKLANPNDLTALSRSRKVSPEELEAAFTKLNDAFTFNQTSGQLTRNPLVQLNADEEQTVQQLLKGYQRQVQAGEIKLRRGANRLFVPLPDEPEVVRQGSITQISNDQIKAFEKRSKQTSLDFSLSSPAFDTNAYPASTDSYLLAGCGWQWWRSTHWWGIRFSLNKTAVNWLTSGAASVSAILGAMGISGIVAAAIGALAGILKAVSNNNGVRIYITWIGLPWATSKPTSSGGC